MFPILLVFPIISICATILAGSHTRLKLLKTIESNGYKYLLQPPGLKAHLQLNFYESLLKLGFDAQLTINNHYFKFFINAINKIISYNFI